MRGPDLPSMKRPLDDHAAKQAVDKGKSSRTLTDDGRGSAPRGNLVDEWREKYRHQAQEAHGIIVNPITGDEVDIMQQCVNLQVDVGNDREVGDTAAYEEVVIHFAEQLAQGTQVWVAMENGQYTRGSINRVNAEDESAVTYDIQYSKTIMEKGKKIEKVFVLKDCARNKIKTQQLLVRGDPAGGKTTFAKQLLTWIMRNKKEKWLVPVLVRTIDLVRSKHLFVDDQCDMVDQFLAMQYAETGWYNFFRQARLQGRLLVILDGFDEAGSLADRLAREVHETLCNEVFIVLTSREMAGVFEKREFERFRGVRVKDLNSQQQRQVIERWLVSKDRALVFCKQLALNPALSHMARNPLLLNVMLSVFGSCDLDGGATLNRGKVYSMALDGMLSNIEKAKAAQSQGMATTECGHICPLALRKVLQQAAFLAHAHDDGHGIRDFSSELMQHAITRSQVGHAFTMDHWRETVELIKKGRLPVLAWFVEDGQDTFRFAHLTFQEFLCAEHCLAATLQDDHFLGYWRDLVCGSRRSNLIRRAWWQQTLQMYCDLSNSAGATLRGGLGLSTALGECFLFLDETPIVEFSLDVNDNNILTIVSMLKDNATVEKLVLANELTSQGVSTFQSLKMTCLRELDLSGNMIGPEGCVSFANFLKFSGAPLQSVSLTNNLICQGKAKPDSPPNSRRNPRTGYYDSFEANLQGLEALLDALSGLRTLRSFDVRGNFLNLAAGQLLFEAVLKADNLHYVCGIPVQAIRDQGVGEVHFRCDKSFIGNWHRRPEPFLSTGGAKLLVEMLLHFPQRNLTTICLANQGLASDSVGVVQLFADLGAVAAAAPKLDTLDVTGFWDCGAAAGAALGRAIKNSPHLKTVSVGMGSIDLSEIRERAISETDCNLEFSSEIRDCGAGILSELLPSSVSGVDIRGAGVGSRGHKALSQVPHLKVINGISMGSFTEESTTVDLSALPPRSTGAVACMIARTALTTRLTHLNLAGSNLTSKSHVHRLIPVVCGGWGIGCNGGCDNRNYKGTNAYLNCPQCDLDFCSTCCMSECPMIALAEALDRLPHLLSLNISNCAFEGGRDGGPVRSHLDEEGYKVLGRALGRHAQLTELDVSLNYFKGPGFPHLAKGIALMPALSKVKLGSHWTDIKELLSEEILVVTPECSYAELLVFSRAIPRSTKLRGLELTNAQRLLNPHIVDALVESLQCGQESCTDDVSKRTRIDGLKLVDAVFRFADIRDGKVSKLDLGAHKGSREVVAPLFLLLLECAKPVVEIDLSNQDFGKHTTRIANAIVSLAGGNLRRYNNIDLQCTPGATELVVPQTPQVMSHGIHVLASTAMLQGHIRILSVAGSGMDAWSLGTLLASLLERPTVTSLDVSSNALQKAGVGELGAFLRSDRTLQVLQARNIGMPRNLSDEMQEFSKALETNITIVKLDIRDNPCHPRILEQLRRTMEEKRNVVPFPLELKICFLLCNRHLPPSMQLPEVTQVAEMSNLFQEGTQNAIFLIFQFCASARQILAGSGDGDGAGGSQLTRFRERLRNHMIERYQLREDDEDLEHFIDRNASDLLSVRRELRRHGLAATESEDDLRSLYSSPTSRSDSEWEME